MEVWLVLAGAHLLGMVAAFPVGLEVTTDESQQFLTGLVGLLLTVCAIVFLAGCLCCHRRNGFKDESKKEFHNNAVVASTSSILDHGHINPVANGEFTIFTPLTPSHFNNNVFLANQQVGGHTDMQYGPDVDLRSWFDGSQVDFPRTKLKYIKEIGKGWFGRVVEGAAQGLNDNDESWLPVAVRILETSASSGERAAFLHDANIYRCGNHFNVLQLMGRSLETVPMLILQELCTTDVKHYLRENQLECDKLLNSEVPLKWCCQLSAGLKHLHDHKLTHADLAARNCQLTSDLTLKLGDYGLGASLYPEDYYEGAPAIPVRWCAPESLTHTSTTLQPKKITMTANIWSLGVVFWEICECGRQPYENLTDDDVIAQVLDSPNVRLGRPSLSVIYTDYVFQLMQICWSTFESRPSITQVNLMLTDLMQVYQKTRNECPNSSIYLNDFDKRWETLKPNNVMRVDNCPFDIPETLSRTQSLSLNNLHGSLDNIAHASDGPMDSWLLNVAAKTDDMSYVRGLSEAMQDLDNALALEGVSSSGSSEPSPAPLHDTAHAQPNMRTSSESETEDENWRSKVETGAYSEKVRQKSKSVTDLMVLTHIDCSESDSETPVSSLETGSFRRRPNLDISLNFGSEGNLLSVKETFQEELKRLQDEHKDSLLFVPDKHSAQTLIDELSSPTDIQPEQQIYNVFNCVVNQTFSPMRSTRIFNVPKLSEIIQNNDELMDFIIATYDPDPEPTVEFDVSDTQAQSNVFSSTPYAKQDDADNDKLDYSLESWDNFIGDAFPKQNTAAFPSFSSSLEPQSLLFLDDCKAEDETYAIDSEKSVWEGNEGWFLHPQTESDLTDDMDQYSGVRMDDEVAEAIRNELLIKLPQAHAQTLDDSDDIKLEERSEVNIKYNVYNAPLSPIPEESSSEHDSHMRTYQRSESTISEYCDWPEPYECPESGEFPDPPDSVESLPIESPIREQTHRHTPSQDSCCSNDTLFNLEELYVEGINRIANESTNSMPLNQVGHCRQNSSQNDVESMGNQNSKFKIVKQDFDIEYNQQTDPTIELVKNDSIIIMNINESARQLCQNLPIKQTEQPSGSARVMKILNKLEKEQASNALDPPAEETKQPISKKPKTNKESIDCKNFNNYTQRFFCKGMEHFCKMAATFTNNQSIQFDNKNEFLRSVDSFIRKEICRLTSEKETKVEETFKKPVEKTEHLDQYETNKQLKLMRLRDSPVIEAIEKELNSFTVRENRGCDVINEIDLLELHKTVSTRIADSFTGPIQFNQNEFLSNVENFLLEEIQNKFGVVDAHAQCNSIDLPRVETLQESLHRELCKDRTNSEQILKKIVREADGSTVLPEINDTFPQFMKKLIGEDEYLSVEKNEETQRNETIEEINSKEEFEGQVGNCNLFESNDVTYESEVKDLFDDKQILEYKEENAHAQTNLVPAHPPPLTIDTTSNLFENATVGFDYLCKFLDSERTHSSNPLGSHHQDARNGELGAFTDLRFNGPCGQQIISNEQDWDSGSDTRSSSSGEFIWKTVVESYSSGKEKSESEESEEDDVDGPEFVPSAWDMYALPGKSALRSPEKDEKQLKKNKGVWFKKQKYHCVYEYPREPESPIINTYDLWQSFGSATSDWGIDYCPSTSTDDDEFFISGTSQPFDCSTSVSEFFPGQNYEQWEGQQNATPDSGVEDIIPTGSIDYSHQIDYVPTLKSLASAAVKPNQMPKEALGGLRYARNKLKLDLPPSPSAFTSGRNFIVELEGVIEREPPTFTTFGKSRFQVQHVATPTDTINDHRNVSFEALPYKPLRKETVRGEASLLDSADEDSGIESSTLERKKNKSLMNC